MKASVKCALALFAAFLTPPANAQTADPLAALLTQDVRLATVAERLMIANRDLCRQRMPVTGFLIHSRDQYQDADVGRTFANGPITIWAVLPRSPAAALRPGDGLVAISGQETSGLQREGEAPLRDSAFGLLANAPTEQPLSLTVMREGQRHAVVLNPPAGCRALVEIRAAQSLDARSDGKVIQVNYGLATAADDDQLAVAFAHELAHAVLEHRRRLEAAGVSKGFFGEFGKNQRLNRQVEVEADRLAVHLLANAGYNPAIAPAFWRSPLGRRASGLTTTYPSSEARARLIEREIAEYLGAGPAPTWPGHLLTRRDVPF
jgi:hypothetical protein